MSPKGLYVGSLVLNVVILGGYGNFFTFSSGTRVWTQGFVLARQALYHSSPFCSGYFRDRVSLFAQADLDQDHPILCFPPLLEWKEHASMCLPFFLFRWNLSNFLCRLVWKYNPPNLSLLHSLGWEACNTAPSYWLRWVSHYFCLDCPYDPPDLSLTSS
jgi:hypothetical protein